MPGLRAGTAVGEWEPRWLPQPQGWLGEVREQPGLGVPAAPSPATASHCLLPPGFPELGILLLGAALKLEAEAVATWGDTSPSLLARTVRQPALSAPGALRGVHSNALRIVVFDRHNLANI